MKTMKKFIFGLTVLLGVSLFLTGCGDAEGGAAGSPGRLGDGHVSGTPSIAGLQAMIDRYNGTGAELVLDNITLNVAGVVDFKGVKAYFVGTAALSNGVVINAVSATVGFAEGAVISGASANDVIIGSSTVFTAERVTGSALVAAPVSGEADFDEVIGPVTAVKDLTLGAADQIPAGLKVFVYGTLTVNKDSEQPSGLNSKVTAIKRVELAGTPDDDDALADDTKVAVNNTEIVITASSHEVEVTLDDELKGAVFNLEHEAAELTVNGATTKFEATVLGNGKLVLAGAVTGVNIIGSGRVQFSNAAAIAFAASSRIATGSTGYALFDNGFTTPTSAATVTLSGNVLIPATKTITFGHANGTVTLKAGTTVSLSGQTPVPVLTAVSDLVLTPAAITSVVTVKAGGEVAVSATAGNTGITFGGSVKFGGDLTLTAAPATFNGTAFFADGKKISLSATQSIITLATGGGALAIGAKAPKVPDVYSTVLSAGDADAVLTPTAALDLTFDAETKSVTQSASTLTVSGKATVTSGASYVVATSSTLSVAASTELTLGAGFLLDEKEGTPPKASLVLKGHASNGGTLGIVETTSKVILGDATGASEIGGVGTVTIGGAGVTVGTLVAGDLQVVGSGTKTLVQIGGTTANGTVKAKTTTDVVIDHTQAVAGS